MVHIVQMLLQHAAHMLLILHIPGKFIFFALICPDKELFPFIKIAEGNHMGGIQAAGKMFFDERGGNLHILGNGYPRFIAMIACFVNRVRMVEAIAAQIIAETPAIPKAIAKANTGSRTLNIVLLAVVYPIWVPLALALAMAALMVYLSIWMVVIALWATVVLLLLCAPIGIAGLVWCYVNGYQLPGLYILGCGLAGTGVGLFAWFGVLAASKGLVKLTHSFAQWVKSLFVKRRENGVEANRRSGEPFDPRTAEGAPYHV